MKGRQLETIGKERDLGGNQNKQAEAKRTVCQKGQNRADRPGQDHQGLPLPRNRGPTWDIYTLQ